MADHRPSNDQSLLLRLPGEKVNSLQVASVLRLIERCKHAHMTDIKLRINGRDEWIEADWLKHLENVT